MEVIAMNIFYENLKNLEKIRDVVPLEEGKAVDLNAIVERLLQFYRKVIPYSWKKPLGIGFLS